MGDWLSAAAEKYPNSPALIDGDQIWTYRQLDTLVNAWCGRLAAFGIKTGHSIGALMPNSTDYVCLIHALARLGAVLFPLNTRLTWRELQGQIEQGICDLLVCADEYKSEANGALRTIPIVTPDDLARETVSFKPAPFDQTRLQAIVFTSGTTGKPKGAQITFDNLYHGALASAQRIGGSFADRWLCPLPFYHVGGLAIVFRACLYGCAIVLPKTGGIDKIMEAIRETPATVVSLVPTMLYRMLEAGFKPSSSLRLILLGGAAASAELIERCIERDLPIALTYGLTEVASQVATMPPDGVRRKPGSVGKPLSGLTVQIVNEEERQLPAGEYGEIVVSGLMVMRGYYGQLPVDGTFHTGDIGYLDDEGDLWLVQRRSDLVVSGGENVYPSEVEAVLRQHPAVADACVVGVPDAEWGQRVAAMVVLRSDAAISEDELITFSRERLAGYKQPRQIVFAAELPQTASGKVQRAVVQKRLSKANA